MNETTKFQRSSLLRNLKDYAFRDNGDFRNGIINESGVQKNYTLSSNFFQGDTPGESTINERRLSLGFVATRSLDLRIRNKPSYSYNITSESERTIEEIPDYVLDTLDDEEKELLEDYDPNALIESASTDYSVSDTDEVDIITTNFDYAISYEGDDVFHHTSSEVLYGQEMFGEPVSIPTIESNFGQATLYITKPVSQEIYTSDVERLENELAFRAIVDPFNTNNLNLHNFDIASKRINTILEIMKNGIGVKRLYDLK
jgi:hypothetical protein